MKKIKSIILFLVIVQSIVFAEEKTDSVKISPFVKKEVVRRSVLPLSLMATGAVISGSRFEKNIKKKLRDGEGVIDYAIPIDDLMQYFPIAQLYVADALGVKAKNHWFDQTKYLIISNVITAALTHGAKFAINKERPNGSSYAFPSGHSSFSFANATVLYEEFHDAAPGFASSGYILTSMVGSLR